MRIAVIGAGAVGVVLTAVLRLGGHDVALWNRGEATLGELRTEGITLQGAVEGQVMPSLLSSRVEDVLAGCELVLVAVPASAHSMIAKLIASSLSDRQVLLLVPGRTFGAIAFQRVLSVAGDKDFPRIAESQTTPFSCRKMAPGLYHVYARKSRIAVANLKRSETACVRDVLTATGLGVFEFASDTLVTSLNNISPLMHCPGMMLNVGLVDAKADMARAIPPPSKFYSEYITPSVAGIIERLDAERLKIARGLGLGAQVESIQQWGARTYDILGESFYEALQKNASYGPIEAPDRLDHRYLTEDVPTGLVPWESLGRDLGVPTPLATLFIDLAQALLETDFRANGRTLANLGFSSAQELRQALLQ